jgi:uncharacterized RDD family membrane protein YckC
MTPTAPDAPRASEPAGLRRRLAAMFYDALLLFAVSWAVTALAVGLRVGLEGETAVRASGRAAAGGIGLQLALAAATVLFFGWFWTRWGQTLGMQAWRLRVETLAGDRISWRQAMLRLAGACVSFACLGAGYLAILFDPESRAWHDRWSGTRVVRETGPRRAD